MSGYGTVSGTVAGAASSTITASGGNLILGDSASPTGFTTSGSIVVGGDTLTLQSAVPAQLGTSTTLNGGILLAPNGITLASGSILTGKGTVSGAVAGAVNSTITASGGNLILGDSASPTGFTTSGVIVVGGSTATLQSAAPALLGISTTLSGGTLAAPNGVQLDGANTISGYGLIRGPISGSNAATGLVATDTYSVTGTLNVGADQITILTKGLSTLGNQTTLAGGFLKSTGGFAVRAGQTISGFGSVAGKISGSTDSLIQASGGQFTLGDASRLDGFATDGNVEAGNNTLVLNSKGFANLGSLTTIGGGVIQAANGISLGVGRNLSGYGSVNGKVAAGFGATILATDNLALGDGSSPSGFTSDGELYTAANTVTLNDSNQAVLGALTQLGNGSSPGTLIATNGFLVDFGRNLVGQGTVQSSNTLAKAAIINGSVQGDSDTQRLTFTGYVKGVGTFSNATFSGTYSPGLSPASVNLQNVNFGPSNTLLVELGGTTAGSQYDTVSIGGNAGLGGTLQVALLGSFRPVHNDQFTVLSFDSRSGDFAATTGLDLGSRLQLVPQYTANSLVLTAVQGGSGVWRADRDGNASLPANWANGLPNGIGDIATFGTIITQARTITIDSPVTLGGMSFDGSHQYTIAGLADITLQQSGDARIDVHNGNHEIAAALKLFSDTTIDVDSAELLISGTIDGNHCLTKTGSGLLTFTQVNNYNGATTVSAGTLALAGNGQISESSPIVNNATFLVADDIAVHTVGAITGSGTTQVGSGANLIAWSISQGTLIIGNGATVTIQAIPGGPLAYNTSTPVPEPSTFVLLCIGALGLFTYSWRKRR